jgi:RimJ/RimL family protein N-acetyltransferase
MSRVIAYTCRLVLDELAPGRDAAFVVQLLNEPGFLHNIGDRGVRDQQTAGAYITHQVHSYRDNGFGLWRLSDRQGGQSLGICGLVRRAGLRCPDLGYAVLQAAWSQGYATEAASATLDYARESLGISMLAAVTKPYNAASQRVLNKLGFKNDGVVELPGEAEPSSYFSLRLALKS